MFSWNKYILNVKHIENGNTLYINVYIKTDGLVVFVYDWENGNILSDFQRHYISQAKL